MVEEVPQKTGGVPGRASLIVNGTVVMLGALGVDMDTVLRNVDLDPGTLGPRSQLPIAKLHRMWDEAIRISGDDTLGLRGAYLMRPRHFDVVGYVVRSSATFREVSDRTARYVGLLTDTWVWQRDTEGDSAVFRLLPARGMPSHPQVSETMLVALALMSRRLTGQHLVVREARFMHPEPKRAPKLAEAFGGPVVFGASADEMLFDPAYLDLPIPGHDPELSALLERHAEQMLDELPRGDAFTHRVRETIAQTLREGSLTSPALARKLAVSERSLRRKLAESQFTYKGLVDEVRHNLARRYLTRDEMSVGEIAFHLGFANVASFGKAFKRWSGSTPGDYRKGGN